MVPPVYLILNERVLVRDFTRGPTGRKRVYWDLRTEVEIWCAERSYRPKLQWYGLPHVRALFPGKNKSFEFKMRWL